MRSFLTDWPVRLAAFAATILACAVGVFLVLLALDRAIILTDPFVGRIWIVLAACLGVLAIILRFGFASLPYARIYGREATPFAITAIKIAAISAAITMLILASFNPIAGPHLHIFIDHNPNVGSDDRAALAEQLTEQRRAWLAAGHSDKDIHYWPGIDSDETKSLVATVASLKAGDPGILTAMDVFLRRLKPPNPNASDYGSAILADLETIASGINETRRAGDRLVVLSTWRGLPESQQWALNSRRFGSQWIQVAGMAGAIGDDEARIQSLEVIHFPGLQPSVSFLIRAKDAAELLKSDPEVFLTSDASKKCSDQAGDLSVPVLRGSSPAIIGALNTGTFETTANVDFVQVRLSLPTSGPQFLCIQFSGASPVHTKLNDPVFVGVRQLELNASPEIMQLLGDLLGVGFKEPKQLSDSPLVAAEVPNGAGSRVTVSYGNVYQGEFDIVKLPPVDEAAAAIGWDLAFSPSVPEAVKLEWLKHAAVPKERLENHSGRYDAGVDCQGNASIITATQQGQGTCKDVLRWAQNRLALYLPPGADISKLGDPQRRALGVILVLTATAAWLNTNKDTPPTAVSWNIYAKTPQTNEAVGWSAGAAPLWRQLLDGLTGVAESRQAPNAANGVRPVLLQAGLLLLAIIAALGVARPISLLFFRSRRSEEQTR